MGYVRKSFNHTAEKQFLLQSDVLLSTFLTLLKESTSQVTDATTLEIFMMMPLAFQSSEMSASVDISFTSNATRVNINGIVPERDANSTRLDPFEPEPLDETIQAYLEEIASVYAVSDTISLVSLIADTVDEDSNERISGSELALEDPRFTQGKIHNMRHFRRILDHYKAQTMDYSVDRVPWERLISFDNKAIDFNYIEPDVLLHLIVDVAPEELIEFTTGRTELYASMEDLPFDDEVKEKLKALNVGFYDPHVKGEIVIGYAAMSLRYTFDYDISSQKVSRIEVSR